MKLPTINTTQINHTEAGELIRKFRVLHKVSQKALADKMGISAPFVCDLEKGYRNWTEEKFILAEKSIRELSKK